MSKRFKNHRQPAVGLHHENHRRPVTRRDFLAQGLISGMGILAAPSLFGLFAGVKNAHAAAADCDVTTSSGIPFLCFDLAGGANIAGSNVLVGKQGGQIDFLETAGYTKLGIADTMLPTDPAQVNNEMGLAFHSASALLAGIKETATAATLGMVNGCVICARSNDDTQNNPHNPMYGIAKAGANGSIVNLIGTSNSVSGGNSVAPSNQIDPKLRPTKIASETDARGLVDVGKLSFQLGQGAVEAMKAAEAIGGIKSGKINEVDTVQTLLKATYGGTTNKIECNSDPSILDATADSNMTSIFANANNLQNTGDFLRASSVTKLVVDGFAGAGTIQFGGYDYHTGNRTVGDAADLKAGRAIGVALEYASRKNKPLIIYVFSDGAVSSNGKTDANVSDNNGNNKLVWTTDNGTCAATFMLVFNPKSKPVTKTQQLGYYRASGSIETTAAPFSNSVTTLAETVVLNYLALNNKAGQLDTVLPKHSLGPASDWDKYIAFEPIV